MIDMNIEAFKQKLERLLKSFNYNRETFSNDEADSIDLICITGNEAKFVLELLDNKQHLIEAEDILGDLSSGYWVSVLDQNDDPVDFKIGQRVLNYWKTFNSVDTNPE
jgi:hypothetical protein